MPTESALLLTAVLFVLVARSPLGLPDTKEPFAKNVAPVASAYWEPRIEFTTSHIRIASVGSHGEGRQVYVRQPFDRPLKTALSTSASGSKEGLIDASTDEFENWLPIVDAFRTWCATTTVSLLETSLLYAGGLATAACCRSHRSSSSNRIRPVS